MIQSQTVIALPSVTLHSIRVNRGESGSPSWKTLCFTDAGDAARFLMMELPENRHKDGVTPVSALYDKSRNVYYVAEGVVPT